MTKKSTLLAWFISLLATCALCGAMLWSPAGKPSTLRYFFVQKGMTRAEVETQLGAGTEPLDQDAEREQMMKVAPAAESVDLVVCWGFQSQGLLGGGPTLIRIGFRNGKVCCKQCRTIGL